MKSILVKSQFKTFIKETDEGYIKVKIRYDDECGNGHNTFAITGEINKYESFSERGYLTGGCIHDQIEKYFPEFSHLIKWHLTSSDGPMHYMANSLYHASDRDHNGLLKDEKKQIINGRTKLPAWHLVAINLKTGEEIELYDLDESIDSNEKPDCNYKLEFMPWCKIGEGKTPDLKAARECAIWPEAELKDFTKENLEKRLPDLIKEFKSDMEKFGFIF